MKITLFFILTVMLMLLGCSDMPTNEQKKITIENILQEYKDCVADAENNMDCKSFTARAICEYNGLDDFKQNGQYIEYNKIYDFIREGDQSWKSLGMATDDGVLEEVQQMVNDNFSVIAVNTSDKHKFTVLIVKGEMGTSGKWGGKVPMCAAFFPASSKLESFINKGINYAWSSPKGVEFFVKR